MDFSAALEVAKSNPAFATAGLVVIAAIGWSLLAKLLFGKSDDKKKLITVKDWKAGVVYMHVFPGMAETVQTSPACLKLETYLRMTKVPYEAVRKPMFGDKGKMPWIELNGEAVSDSTLAIEAINDHFNVNLDTKLTPQQRAVAHAFQTMLEDRFYFTITFHRWVENFDVTKRTILRLPFPISAIVGPIVQSRVRKTLWLQGLGRFKREQIFEFARRDLEALSTLLGDQKFFFGDEPSHFDAIAFGFLAAVCWSPFTDHAVHPQKQMIEKLYPNLFTYILRMRDRFWPDWEQLCIDATRH